MVIMYTVILGSASSASRTHNYNQNGVHQHHIQSKYHSHVSLFLGSVTVTVTAVFLVGKDMNVKNSFIFSFLHLDPMNMVFRCHWCHWCHFYSLIMKF